MARIGVDVGGTFTDFAMAGGPLETPAIHKQLTTPDDPSRAVLEGIALLTTRHGIPLHEIEEIVHGTTLVTNAVIERTGARTGMLVTQGFADLLDMGLEQRYDLFDLRIRFAPPVIPRHARREIPERTRYDGTIETPLDEPAVAAAIRHLVDVEQIEALAICFLHSYTNPTHERRAASIAARFPGLQISTSADIFPAMREFERWTTTTVNAYTQPRFDAYLARLESGLAAQGYRGQLHLMSSSGGTVTAATARRYPVRMLESGPAAGVLMTAVHGQRLSFPNILSFDLGGTTAKGALIRNGRPLKNDSMEVARCYQHRRGSGLTLKLPVIDMTEIGAGGGSIAAIDERQLLRVGPYSAGAVPGPACYGRGGSHPTLTDANLLLGYLDPDFFLGGAMPLSPAKARQAIEHHIARPLDLDPIRAAWGIHETINEDIARAFRVHAVERGFDCRDATIVAFGGGGPIHATAIARKLRAPRVVFPMAAGVMSALGLLASPMLFETARTQPALLATIDDAQFDTILGALSREAAAFLTQAGVTGITIERRVDLRYQGQGYELEIQIPAGAGALAFLPHLFAERYHQVFKVDPLDEPLEVIAWKVEARGPTPKPWQQGRGPGTPAQPQKRSRTAYFPNPTETPVWDRYALRPTDRIEGPALIEERESTVILRPGDTATVDAHLNLVAEIAP